MVKTERIRYIFKTFWDTFGGYKRQILLMSGLGFMGSITEGIGIGSMIPLLSLAGGSSAAGTDVLSQAIQKAFLFLHLPFTIKFILIGIFLMFLLRTVFIFLSNYVTALIVNDFQLNMRKRLFALTLGSRWEYLAKQKMGHLEQSLTTIVDTGPHIFKQMSSLLMLSFALLVYTVLAMNVSVIATLGSLGLVVVSFLILKPLFYRTRAASKETEVWYRDIAHHINQTMIGIKSIKAGAAENAFLTKADQLFTKYKKLDLRLTIINAFIGALSKPLSILFILLLFVFFYKIQGFEYPSFIVIVYAIYRIFNYSEGIQHEVNKLNTTVPYLNSLQDFESDVRKQQEADKGQGQFKFNRAIEFKNVFFNYEGGREVLNGLGFQISKGETIGLIGPSGAGKTTIVDLLLRLYQPKTGEILVDGIDVSLISMREWRKQIGYVPQDPFLLNDSIANNIKFYNPAITDVKMREAATLAQSIDFIESQPQGFETVVGDRGVLLSGGQRQRIVLAKILAQSPKILILDEATNALDAESEQAIKQTIKQLHGKMTIIIIAHRPSTVVDVGRILVLNQGRIVEEGKPATILSDKTSYFYKMYQAGIYGLN
ncbi:MAG: hypothetical protein CMI54_03700 [Parcubacteria group bacterium]|nr:hypothetical protein [Parcubacteria group bacterium]|tara:strand:- start:25890 stop:27686 length:1797 start_codon:yes stop_codon:yes gene_type:complete